VLAAACSSSYGPLTADTRVKLLEPKPGSTVTNPVTLRWSSRFEPGTGSGRWFGVYLDTAPAAPGSSVLAAAAEPCADVAACLGAGAIDGPNVWLTDRHQVEAGQLPGPEHRYTVVLVDEQGNRQGAVAWNASFRIEP
jgi:hypothetical protein